MKKSLFRFALPPAPMLALICALLCAALPAPALGASFLDRVIDRASDAALDKADEAVKNYLGDDPAPAKVPAPVPQRSQPKAQPQVQRQTRAATPAPQASQPKVQPQTQAAPSAASQEAPVNLIFSSKADYEATKQLAPKAAYQAGEEVIVFARLARPVGERIAIFSSSPDMTEHAINCDPDSASFTAVWSWSAPGTYTVKFISNSGRLLAQGKVNVIGAPGQAAVAAEEGSSPQTPIHLGKVTWERVEMEKLLRQPMTRYYAFTLTSDAVVKFHAFTNIDFDPKAKTPGVELWVNGELAGEIGYLVNTRDNPTIKIKDELDREYTLPAGEHTFNVLSSDADNGVVTLQINVSRIKK